MNEFCERFAYYGELCYDDNSRLTASRTPCESPQRKGPRWRRGRDADASTSRVSSPRTAPSSLLIDIYPRLSRYLFPNRAQALRRTSSRTTLR